VYAPSVVVTFDDACVRLDPISKRVDI